MTEPLWTAVDRYITDMLVPSDAALDGALEASVNSGLPAIQVTPNQGKLLHLLARLQGARRILEIGTLGGYSTIWLARALPADGKLVTLEVEAKHAEVAKANIHTAALSASFASARRSIRSRNCAPMASVRSTSSSSMRTKRTSPYIWSGRSA